MLLNDHANQYLPHVEFPRVCLAPEALAPFPSPPLTATLSAERSIVTIVRHNTSTSPPHPTPALPHPSEEQLECHVTGGGKEALVGLEMWGKAWRDVRP